MSIKATKDQARSLATALKGLGINLTHHKALEVVSKVFGAKGWNQFAATDSSPAKPKQELTEAQRILLDAAIKQYVEEQGVPDVPFQIAVAGDVFGNINYLTGDWASSDSLSDVELVVMSGLEPKHQNQQFFPSVHYITATLCDNDARECQILDYQVLDFQEVCNRSIDLELKHMKAITRLRCVATGTMNKSGAAVHPCIGDAPVWEWAVPPRVWALARQAARQLETAKKPCELEKMYLPFEPKPGQRVRVTVGEMHAAVLSAYRDPDTPM